MYVKFQNVKKIKQNNTKGYTIVDHTREKN